MKTEQKPSTQTETTINTWEMPETILNQLSNAIVVFHRSAEGTLSIRYANEFAEQLIGREELPLLSHHDIISLIHPEDRVWMEQRIEETASQYEGMDETYRLVNTQGRVIWVHHVSRALPQPGGNCLFYAVYTDFAENKTVKELKSVLVRHYQSYFENRFDIDAPSSVLNAIDLQGTVFESIVNAYTVVELANLDNDTYIDIGSIDLVKKLMHGLTSTRDVLSRVVEYLIDPEFREEARIFMDTHTLPERLKNRKTLSMDYNGSVAGWCRGQIIPVTYHEDGRAKEAIFTVQRIQDEKIKMETLRKLSETDGLSQLLNRTSGEAYINKHLNRGGSGMFCLFDVDSFKHFNDQYGHAVGDEIIRSISLCMKDTFREEDILVRTGGDEFVIFVPDLLDREIGDSRIQKFCNQIAMLSFPQFQEAISISTGVVFTDACKTQSFDRLFQSADALMYQQKHAKKLPHRDDPYV